MQGCMGDHWTSESELKSPSDLLLQLVYPNYEALFTRLKWQYWAFQFLILAHILVVAYTDPLDNTSLTIQVLVVW